MCKPIRVIVNLFIWTQYIIGIVCYDRRLRAAKIFEPPVNTHVLTGDTAIFFCRAHGNPSPTVHFLLDRSLPDPLQQASVGIPDGSVLRLSKVGRAQNGLQVQCVARNHVGGDSASAQLTVYERNLKLPEGFPVIRVPPNSMVASVGDVAQLDCEAIGNPLPKVIWIKNEIPIPLNSARLTVTGTGMLQFDHVLSSDEGHYECLVANNVGSVISPKALLKIKNTYSPPNIVNKVDHLRVRPGHGANLTCRATGNPVPHTRWLTDRQSPITEHHESSTTLFVADISEPTRYICEANNSLGTIQHPVRILMMEVPPPPRNLQTLEIGPHHVFLQWLPPKPSSKSQSWTQDVMRIDSYTLFLAEHTKLGSSPINKRQITDISATQQHPDGALQYKISNLKPFSQYAVEVTAVSNSLGMSDPSNTVTFTTAEVAPSSPPLMLNAYALSDSSAEVEWKEPHQPNGRVTGYRVLYTVDKTLPFTKWLRLSTNMQSVQLKNLKPGTTYHVRVAAENTVGVGPYSDSLPVVVKFGVPSQPINLQAFTIAPDKLYLNWTEPRIAAGVHLLGYKLLYRSEQTVRGETAPFEHSLSSSKTDHIIEQLSPNTTYLISLSGYTKYGQGVASQLSVRTESEVPGMPIPKDLEVLNSSTIRVAWNNPLTNPDSNLDIPFLKPHHTKPSEAQYFLLQWAPFPFTEWKDRKIEANQDADYLYNQYIDRLLSNTAYQIRVGAVGTHGMGPVFSWDPVKTRRQIPSAPQNLRLNQLRRVQPYKQDGIKSEVAILELAWDPPERSHGELKGFQVSHWELSPDRGALIEYNSEIRGSKVYRRNVTQTFYKSTISEGIKFGRSYQFEVAAFNGVDLGLPAQLNITLPEDAPEAYPIQVRLNGLSATSIEVTWTPPKPTQLHEEIINYQVKYFQPHAPNKTEVVRSSTEPRMVIENLQERTFYTVMVRAIAKSGPGPWSVASTIQTTAELPEPPSHITGIRINPRQIKVTWDIKPGLEKLHQRVIPVTGFRIYYSQNFKDSNDLTSWNVLDVGPVTMATLDDLDPNSEYVIKMKSRGSDRRYGRLSDQIVVGTQLPEELEPEGLANLPAADKVLVRMLSVNALSCQWTPRLDTAKPEEASLKLNWQRPFQAEGLHRFKIQLFGTKSFVDENNQPRRQTFEPRTLEVTQAMLEPSHSDQGSPMALSYLPSSEQRNLEHGKPPNYSLVIDALVANTVYDVHIHPVYLSQLVPGHISESIVLTGRTSCRTAMLPPLFVAPPVPVAVKPQTKQVVMRVFRSSEVLGRIRRYYLILSKTIAQVDFNVEPENDESYWHAKFHESSHTWDPEVFIAAEYSQEVFDQPSIELLISNPIYQARKRRTLRENRTFDVGAFQADSLDVYDPAVLIHGRELIFNQDYRAFVLACAYRNTDSTETSISPQEHIAQKRPNSCSSSAWSIEFSPQSLATSSPDSQPSIVSTDASIQSVQHGKSRDAFTVAIIAVIVGLGLVAVVCITVGCVMRRRPKKMKSDRSITLASAEESLKMPLMGPPKLPDLDQKSEQISDTRSPTIPVASPKPRPKLRAAIAMENLAEHVNKLKMNGGLEMSDEYESIEAETDCTWRTANKEENRPKNRYANVVAYDHSRVILTEISGIPCSDYINANYIDGYQRPRAYIATQGPLPETFYDFWRMVWEQNSRIIVMMTKLEERARVKCDQYWPNRGSETYSCSSDAKVANIAPNFTVSIGETSEFAYYVLRTFVLRRQHLQESEQREIKHFQFTAWPDYGTPDQTQPLLLFIRRVTQIRSHLMHQLNQERLANGDSYGAGSHARKPSDNQRPTSPTFGDDFGPLIVHCSAGVGRTGAFIVIDTQLERLRKEKSIDIFGSVGRMRSQRNFMVQTEEQYTFLYDVFVEAATVHGTEVTAHGLYNHVVKLRQTIPVNMLNSSRQVANGLVDFSTCKSDAAIGQVGLELEFKRIPENLLLSNKFTTAQFQENRLKNRNPEILPFENNRVCLPLIKGIPGSDYINASFVDGYRRRRAYIATQTPLPNTADDFWRLIWEHNSPIIVTLIDPKNLAASSDIYWPMERSTRYQHLLVEPQVEYNMPNFILREFRLTDSRDGQSRTVRQFQMHGWSQDTAVPRLADGMIDLIGQVHKTLTQFGQDGPITVHCSSGSGRSGVFICLSLLLERMRCEGMVDLFLTTRMLRTQRPAMVQTADQYAFCYAATLEYLASFDHYTT